MKSVLQQLLLNASASKTDRLASLVPRLTPFFHISVCVDNNTQTRKSGRTSSGALKASQLDGELPPPPPSSVHNHPR